MTSIKKLNYDFELLGIPNNAITDVLNFDTLWMLFSYVTKAETTNVDNPRPGHVYNRVQMDGKIKMENTEKRV